MTIGFNKNDPHSENRVFSLDLARDLKALTKPLNPHEQLEIKQTFIAMAQKGVLDELPTFSSAAEFEVFLEQNAPDLSSKTFKRFVNRAYLFEEKLISVTPHPNDGALFYDFKPLGSADTGDSLLAGVDLYISDHGSQSIDTSEHYDFSEIPHSILHGDKSSPYFQASSEDTLYIMSCLEHVTYSSPSSRKNGIKDIVSKVITVNTEDQSCALRCNVSEKILTMFSLVDSMTHHCQLTPSQVITLLTMASKLYENTLTEMGSQTFLKNAGVDVAKYKASKHRVHDQRHALSLAQPHLTEDSFYNFLAEGLVNAESVIDLLEQHFPNAETCQTQTIETLFKFHYLTSNELETIINKLEDNGADVVAELDILCGLNYTDITTAIDRSFDTAFISSHHLRDSFNNYYHENHENKFVPHQQYAAQMISQYGLSGITPEMVSLIIMIESEGEKNKENPAGTHFGLMQVGQEAYKQITKKDISLENLNNEVTGHPGWQRNIEIGTRYLHWSLQNFNPVQSLAIVKGNFNYGPAGMLEYRMPHMYDIGEPYALNGETASYIAKYLVYRRWLHESN
ncbi:MAG: transglycosylase SLT domain-containing protein [bacterium]|nr:transglycosylase SLT domain-containing protein [bacterium]MBU1918412.1 transglycosylase SLT domain-containing protein [bacterium]